MQLSPETKAHARRAGWSPALIERLEQSPATDSQVSNLAHGRIAEPRVGAWLNFVANNPDNPFIHAPLSVLRTKAETGMRGRPGPDGLRLRNVETGSYGVVPDVWHLENDTPRGTEPLPGPFLPASYSIYDKAEVWAENAIDLYEDAIRDRWIPATDLDWQHGLRQLPEEMERAICQLCTIYSNHGLVEQKVIGKWLEEISYGFHEVKLFLGTQIYDAGRKVEALRKRALANGGGLGQAPLGQVYRAWYGALTLTDMLLALDVVYKSYEVSLFEAAEEYVQTDLERKLFSLLARDSRRHLAYGLEHLRWYARYEPNAERNLPLFFIRAEAALVAEMRLSAVERESLILLLGGGVERLAAGVDKLKTIRGRQFSDYLARLDSIGMDRFTRAHPGLRAQSENPLESAAVAVRNIAQPSN